MIRKFMTGRNPKRFIFPVLALIFSLGVSAQAGAMVGEKAPEFTLQSVDGATVSSQNYNGKILILDFWATWCPPCRKEIPHFISLQKKYQDKGVEVVGVSVDQDGARAVVPFARQNNINYTMLLANNEIIEGFGGIRGIPTTFVIGRDGTIFKKYVGYRSQDVFENDIKELLGS